MADESNPPILTAYKLHDFPVMPIVPAPAVRNWMDETHDKFAYRCLPMLIANQCGWFLLNVHRIQVIWNGGNAPADMRVILKADKDNPKGVPCPADNYFGHGVLTWNVNYVFRTPPGWNLWARGPVNMPKANIAPLEGIIETDWTVASFTMNWKVTTPNVPIDFHIGEPVCMIVPIRRGDVESFSPEIRMIQSNPELTTAYSHWAKSRVDFNTKLRIPETEEAKKQWQRDYLQGQTAQGVPAPQHQVKLVLKEFQKRD